jgi:Tfp pilus assembly protein PilN
VKALHLDFIRSPRSSAWPGRVLFAVALAVCADAGWSYYRLQGAIAQDEAKLAAAPPRAKRKVAPEEVAAAREAVQRLSMPWTRLFGALESAASDQVALLAIEPDPRNGTVTISGDSKDYLAALTYVLNLRRAEGLAEVQLVRHEQKSKDPQRPVHFSVSASWAR